MELYQTIIIKDMIINYFSFGRMINIPPNINLCSDRIEWIVWIYETISKTCGYPYYQLKVPGMYIYMHLSTHSNIIQNTCADTC